MNKATDALSRSIIPTVLTLEKKIPLELKAKILNTIPKVLRPSLAVLPNAVKNQIMLKALTHVFFDELEDGDLAFLQHKWLKISITDLQLDWYISYNKHKFIVAHATEQLVEDVSFSANGDDLLLIAGRKEDPDTLFFQRRLKIEGDTELGLEIKNLIDALDTDKLSRRINLIINFFSSIIQKNR